MHLLSWKLRQKNGKFEASQGCIVRPNLKKSIRRALLHRKMPATTCKRNDRIRKTVFAGQAEWLKCRVSA
jgi:hypothetical protein